MTDRRIDCFFYGLFMDEEVLRKNNVAAENPRRASVDDFELRIGARATLVPATGARSYGIVYALTYDEMGKLYSAPGLTDYRPEAVVADLLDGGAVPALCFNLGEAPAPHEANDAYAAELRCVLERYGFPAKYVSSV